MYTKMTRHHNKIQYNSHQYAHVLFPVLIALLKDMDGTPLVASGLVCSCLRWPHKRKPNKTYKENSSCCFHNLQHYNNYSTFHNASQFSTSLSATKLCYRGSWDQNKCHMSILVPTIHLYDDIALA